MEQHLQLLALGRPILKPVYDHTAGRLGRPVPVEPRDFVIVEGLLPLHTKLARACFDITVFLDPPEAIRREWKLRRDCKDRGYSPDQVLRRARAARARRRGLHQAAAAVGRHRDQVRSRRRATAPRTDTPLSAEILLRPTIVHPDLSHVLTDDDRRTVHLKLIRDSDGRPVDALHVHGYAPREDSEVVEKAIWEQLSMDRQPRRRTAWAIRAAAGAARRWRSRSCCSCGICWKPGHDPHNGMLWQPPRAGASR